jgi:hypothetical protein
MNTDVWFYVSWVGGVCLCVIIVAVTLNVLVAVGRNIRKPPPPPPPIIPPPALGPPRSSSDFWDVNGRG